MKPIKPGGKVKMKETDPCASRPNPPNSVNICNHTYKELDEVCAQATISAFKSLYESEEQPLLTIELQDENLEPTVYHKGKRLKYLDQVAFEWGTSREFGISNLDYEIIRHIKGFKKESIKVRTDYDE